jgi:hypothetical protein
MQELVLQLSEMSIVTFIFFTKKKKKEKKGIEKQILHVWKFFTNKLLALTSR